MQTNEKIYSQGAEYLKSIQEIPTNRIIEII